MQIISQLISYLLHPIFMPSLGVLLLFFYTLDFDYVAVSYADEETLRDISMLVKVPGENKSSFFFRLVLPFTFLFPIIHLIVLKVGKHITSFHLTEKEERIPVFIGTFLFYLIGYVLLRSMIPYQFPDVYYATVFGGTISVLVALLVTHQFKISIHAIGIFGLAGLMLAIGEKFGPFQLEVMAGSLKQTTLYIMLLGGIVCSARLALNAHTLPQILAGIVVGFCSMYFPVKYDFFF